MLKAETNHRGTEAQREADLVAQLMRLINCAVSVLVRFSEYPPCSDGATAREFLRAEITRAERVVKGLPPCVADEEEPEQIVKKMETKR